MLSKYDRPIYGTEITVSPIGLGSVKFGRNTGVKYPSRFELPSDQDIIEILALAKDLGINLIDTAPAYGNSEERIGKLTQRKDWIVSTKVGEFFDGSQSHFYFDQKSIQASIQKSLSNLKTDYLDIVLIHSDGNDLDILQKSAAVETLHTLKAKGLIRAIGISSKTVKGALYAISEAKLDIAMVTYNIDYLDEKPVINYANQHHKNTFIKKVFASGHLPNKSNHQDILTHAMSADPTSLILGTINPKHLAKNCQVVYEYLQKRSSL